MKRLGIVFLILVLAACKKDELPENSIGTPVFISEVNFNGNDYSLIAGENGLVLNPSVAVTDSSVEFVSDLSNPSCEECGPEIKLSIASPQTYDPNTAVNWIGDLENWNYALELEVADSSEVLQILASNGNNISDGHWFLDGEQISSVESSSIELTLEEQGSYELSYSDDDSDCVPGEPININYNGGEIPCYGSISQSVIDPDLFIAQPGPAYDPVNTAYIWFVDGSIIATGENTITADANTVSQVSVIMLGGFGCMDTVNYIPQNNFIPCANNLRIDSSEFVTIVPEPSDVSFVTIEFTGSDGSEYSSTGGQENSTIQLISINPYEEPTRPGESFAEVTFEVSCNLYDEGGQAFPFSGQINMALKLPN